MSRRVGFVHFTNHQSAARAVKSTFSCGVCFLYSDVPVVGGRFGGWRGLILYCALVIFLVSVTNRIIPQDGNTEIEVRFAINSRAAPSDNERDRDRDRDRDRRPETKLVIIHQHCFLVFYCPPDFVCFVLSLCLT